MKQTIITRGRHQIIVGRRALDLTILQLADEPIELSLIFDQPGGSAQVRALTIARGTAAPQLTVTCRHIAPQTTGRFLGRALLQDESRLNFRGLINIEAGAAGTDAALEHRTLLFDRASVRAQPELEIAADEVQCRHAAAISQLADEPLRYLRSRGLSESEARRLLIDGWLSDIINTLTPTWRLRLRRLIRY